MTRRESLRLERSQKWFGRGGRVRARIAPLSSLWTGRNLVFANLVVWGAALPLAVL
jgi:hypothetical protein